MNEPKFKVGDKVFTDNIIGEVTDVYYIGEKPRYRIKTPNVEICTFGEGCKIVDGVCFFDGADIEERYAESVKDEVPDEEVPKELHPAVEKFKKLLDDTMVNHPPHYTAGKVECIDALESATVNLTGIEAVCTANAIKYLWRWKQKNGVEDLRKAQWYISRLIAVCEEQTNNTW